MWPNHSPREVVRTEYVPVLGADTRPYKSKWEDVPYLRGVSGLGENAAFVCETLEALRVVRAAADTAGTPDELKGCQVGIRAIQGLLTASERARAVLQWQRDAAREYDDVESDG